MRRAGGLVLLAALLAASGCTYPDDLSSEAELLRAKNVSCGELVTSSVKLRTDLTCTVSALVIAADDVTIDLGGHTLTGLSQSAPDPRWSGVKTLRGTNLKNVALVNGTIVGFDRGVDIRNASGILIKNVTIRDPLSGTGIVANGDDDLVVRTSR